ncbi:uncharacterized protein LOC132757551 [Ruditapes philippinarum]|uniref:uncharacterized protein LOC132757551 n=1 Tax=Ruditapes philippinarum TaxID=129788 RepID=UPI00295B56E3|nr:uncharacterized protein LOC132757551 [Ruditapes philippinarum]
MLLSDDDDKHIKTQISIGDCVRPYNSDLYGTVGPFVRIKETGEMCFVTVRHIFGGLQQSNHMFIGSKVVHIQNINNNEEIERVCGMVVACEYSEDYDAVLVKLSPDYIPNRYSFAAVNEEMFQKEGLSGAPKYASIHSVIDVRNECLNEMSDKLLIKIGNQTGWTKGTLLITDGIINKEQAVVLYEHPNQWIIQAVLTVLRLHKREIADLQYICWITTVSLIV